MMEPILESFPDLFKNIRMNAPTIPFLSDVTGTWISPTQATDPEYWSSQLRMTVRFSDGVGELLKTPGRLLLEVGPGHTLSSFTKQHPAKASDQLVLSSFSKTKDTTSEMYEVMTALGLLWIAGVSVDWLAMSAGQKRRRVPLPTYPFERKKYWIEPPKSTRRAPTVEEISPSSFKVAMDVSGAGSEDNASQRTGLG